MSNERLTPRQAAARLNCSTETIRSMLHDGLLSGEKVDGQWRVKTSEVKRWRIFIGSPPPIEVDPGMVEANLALAGIAAAIAAILSGISGALETLRLLIATLAGILAVFSAYSALLLLAHYCIEKPMPGFKKVWTLLTRPDKVKPYWFMALALLIWLILSVLIGVLAVMR